MTIPPRRLAYAIERNPPRVSRLEASLGHGRTHRENTATTQLDSKTQCHLLPHPERDKSPGSLPTRGEMIRQRVPPLDEGEDEEDNRGPTGKGCTPTEGEASERDRRSGSGWAAVQKWGPRGWTEAREGEHDQSGASHLSSKGP